MLDAMLEVDTSEMDAWYAQEEATLPGSPDYDSRWNEGRDPCDACDCCTFDCEQWEPEDMRNDWMDEINTEPFAALADGTPLHPAYYHLRRGERFRRRMGFWNGAEGEWVGVTLDGRLYRQERHWGGDEPNPWRWERFTVSG
jgi:hypothetical protein